MSERNNTPHGTIKCWVGRTLYCTRLNATERTRIRRSTVCTDLLRWTRAFQALAQYNKRRCSRIIRFICYILVHDAASHTIQQYQCHAGTDCSAPGTPHHHASRTNNEIAISLPTQHQYFCDVDLLAGLQYTVCNHARWRGRRRWRGRSRWLRGAVSIVTAGDGTPRYGVVDEIAACENSIMVAYCAAPVDWSRTV